VLPIYSFQFKFAFSATLPELVFPILLLLSAVKGHLPVWSFWTLTLIYELDLDTFRYASHLGQKSFRSNVIVRTHTHTKRTDCTSRTTKCLIMMFLMVTVVYLRHWALESCKGTISPHRPHSCQFVRVLPCVHALSPSLTHLHPSVPIRTLPRSHLSPSRPISMQILTCLMLSE